MKKAGVFNQPARDENLFDDWDAVNQMMELSMSAPPPAADISVNNNNANDVKLVDYGEWEAELDLNRELTL